MGKPNRAKAGAGKQRKVSSLAQKRLEAEIQDDALPATDGA